MKMESPLSNGLTNNMAKKFNYAVGHYWEGNKGNAGFYTSFGEIHYGTLKDAKEYLKYVKEKNSDEDWRIFEVKELDLSKKKS